jgi:poly(A) polymerase
VTGLLHHEAVRPIFLALPEARLVGGCVRDTLAKVPTTDIDIATPDQPQAVRRALRKIGIRTIATGIAHGTLTALSLGTSIEITTLRRDEATDGRHAQVAWTDSWEEDAARRDFTINAMSMERDGTLHDYFGGAADLAEGRIRFVGEAARRIAEDRLRILRFFRFLARYGRGEPDEQAVRAIAAEAPNLPQLSAERIWSELKRILAIPDPGAAIGLMQRLGVLAAILPEGTDTDAFTLKIRCGLPPDALLRLGALVSGDARSAAERLRMSNAECARLLAMRAAPVPSPADGEAARRRMLAEEAPGALIDRTWLEGGFGEEWDGLRRWLAETPRPVFPLSGRDLLAQGMQPGETLGLLLAQIRQWWLQGGCQADKAGCLAQASRLRHQA